MASLLPNGSEDAFPGPYMEVAVLDYWFVRARHIETGREVQRIAAPSRDGDGLATAAIAAEDMKAFLVGAGIATEGAESWQIVEAHRFGEAQSSAPRASRVART